MECPQFSGTFLFAFQVVLFFYFFFFQAEDGIRDVAVTGVQTCALPISALPDTEAPAPAATAPRSSPSAAAALPRRPADRKSTRLNSSHGYISYAVFCLKKKKNLASHVAATPSTTALRTCFSVRFRTSTP